MWRKYGCGCSDNMQKTKGAIAVSLSAEGGRKIVLFGYGPIWLPGSLRSLGNLCH